VVVVEIASVKTKGLIVRREMQTSRSSDILPLLLKSNTRVDRVVRQASQLATRLQMVDPQVEAGMGKCMKILEAG
jgi:hypothetical protein